MSDTLHKVLEMHRAKERLDWLHTGSGRDPDGYEWGVFRVKWNAQGQPESVLQTCSDHSDLDREMKREKEAARAELRELRAKEHLTPEEHFRFHDLERLAGAEPVEIKIG